MLKFQKSVDIDTFQHANRLLEKEAASRTTHDKHCHQLNLHLGEIEDLRKALSDRSGQLHRVEAEKNRIATERSDVAQTVAALEADLKRVRENAEAFGRDLKDLRAEKEKLEKKHQEEQSKAERTKKQTQTQIRLLTEQLDGQRAKTTRAREELENHVCAMYDPSPSDCFCFTDNSAGMTASSPLSSFSTTRKPRV